MKRVTLRICGNTQNVYDARLGIHSVSNDKQSMYVWNCNCPDMRVHAKRDKCVCKHVCFMIYKVLKLHGDEADKLVKRDPFVMDDEKFCEYASILQSRACNPCDDVVNHDLLKKLAEHDANPKRSAEMFQPSDQARDADMCPVCFDAIQVRDASVAMCPDCKNIVHKECMEMIISHNPTSSLRCVYCRSEIWASFKEKGNNCVNIAGKEYLNLGRI